MIPPKPDAKKSYVPALGFHRLSALYDPMIRRWAAAARMRKAVIDALALRPGMEVLEVGAGPGRLAIQIKQAYPGVKLEALDIDSRMIARADGNAETSGVEIRFREADMTCIADSKKFDRVYSTMTFHHLSPAQKREALRCIRAALRPDGLFVVADFGRPRGLLQWALFSCIQQPLDGFENTTPHRDGRYQRDLESCFPDLRLVEAWRTIAGTIELFVCKP